MTEITAPAGFFWDNAVSPTTATDLITAVEAAESNVNNALISEENAAASATAAASSAMSASGSQTAAATSETNAANSATAAAGSVTSANTAASAAANSATSAATQATIATTQASNSLSSANAAASSATAAANSATNAATSATAAAASATTASNAAATIPAPSVGRKLNFIRVNNSGNAYEVQTAAQVATDIGALNDVGRNKLHNALFRIAQRGVGPFAFNGTYTLDRWQIALNTDTVSVTKQALADADRTAIGDEEAFSALQNVFTGNAAAGAYNYVVQKVEDLQRLAGKTVSVSFWAKAASGTPKIGVSIDQFFGTGGSPSSTVNGNGTAVTISATWARYNVTLAIPSVIGSTLGTNSDHYTALNLWFSSGSTNATRAGSVGVQSGTVQLWGTQLEVGSIITPLEKVDTQSDLAKCQRFYINGQSLTVGGAAANGNAIHIPVYFPVTLRATPTGNAVLTGGSGYTGVSIGSTSTTNMDVTTTATSTVYVAALTYNASADL